MAASVVYSTFGGRVVAEDRGGVISQCVPDNLGSTVALIDTSGNVTDTYNYWPYGETRAHVGTSTTPLTFLGTLGYFKDFLNMLYVRARHLRVDLTTWMTVDPLWPVLPAYGYCSADPAGCADPTGLLDFPPLYGNYCGPQSGKYHYPPCKPDRPNPIDGIDACCQAHDDCFFNKGCNAFNQVVFLKCRICTAKLCQCAMAANCNWDVLCNVARVVILRYACGFEFGLGPLLPPLPLPLARLA